jgi:hypothetical protein
VKPCLAILLPALALAACQPATSPAPSADSRAAVDAVPASASTVGAPATPTTAVLPADGMVDANGYDPREINFGGFRSARYNDDAAAVQRAWGQPMAPVPAPDSPDACHYLLTQPRGAKGFGLAFMMEGGKFVRVDVDGPKLVAPGGIRVGQSAAAVLAAFPGQVMEQPHKYVQGGKVLVVAPADGGEARLVFETDARGIVTSWRIGLEPQVHYVEGCS